MSAAMRAAIAERLNKGEIDLMVYDFLNPSINLPDHVNCASLLFQHNVEAMIGRRHYKVETHPLKKAYLKGQWKKSVTYDKAACQRFDYVAAVSLEDERSMRRPSVKRAIVPDSLVFTGSMDWLPNEDAIIYFHSRILPLIKRQIPELRLTVVGRSPSATLLELSRCDATLKVTGRVEDVRPYMEQAAAYVIPLRIGGGTRLKVYDAMAMGLPVISTTVGVEGLPVTHGQDLLIANEPASLHRQLFEHYAMRLSPSG